MNIGTQIQLGWEMFLDWLRETFGSGVVFPTLAPNAGNYQYSK